MVNEQDWLFCYYRKDDHLAFKIACVFHKGTMRYVVVPWQWEIVNNVDYEVIVGEVQQQLINATKHLKKELERHLWHQKVTCILGTCYLYYWLIDTFEATYHGHIATLRTFYGTTKKLWVSTDIETKDVEVQVTPLLGIRKLEL